MKLLYCLFALICFFSTGSVPIDTPDQPERSRFVIKAPAGWAYRTFKGDNGLIGVLWPKQTSFNDCETAVFVFIQDFNEVFLPEIPENSQLFIEKCPKSEFKFASVEEDNDQTLSIEEKYFTGFCGRTEVMFEEKVENLRLITVLASAFYISDKLFDDVKYIVSAYKKEVKNSFKKEKAPADTENIENNAPLNIIEQPKIPEIIEQPRILDSREDPILNRRPRRIRSVMDKTNSPRFQTYPN